MRKNVADVFPSYSAKHEGSFLSPYADIRGLITCSIGVLIDPIELALGVDWRIGERVATEAEVRDDWHALKSRSELKSWTAKRQAPLTSIRLTQAGSDALVRKRLQANVAYIKKFLTAWDTAPADAQLAVASLCWAVGAGLNKTRPAFVAAFNDGNWLACKQHARIREDNNPGVVGRNRDQERCFDNALTVTENSLDPAVLHWPALVLKPVNV